MNEIIYKTLHHHVLSIYGKYQVRASETNYSCGYYESRQAAIKRAQKLTERRIAHDKQGGYDSRLETNKQGLASF